LSECKDEIKEILMNVRFYEDTEISDELLDEFLKKKIFDLSGGQQQRYWFMRILFEYKRLIGNHVPAELLVLDESIASLDCMTKNKIIEFLLKEVFFGRGITILLISHDLRDISIIYETLLKLFTLENIDNVFEHYEMFNKGIYKVLTPFSQYRENLLNQNINEYMSIEDSIKLNLKLKLPESGIKG
jgi:ABC-type dipeptide/oligopeptide/nickel transport system ATPase subunit